MLLFEYDTRIDDLNYYEALDIEEGEWFSIDKVDIDRIQVFRQRRLLGYLPKTIARHVTFAGPDCYVQVICTGTKDMQVQIVVRVFALARFGGHGE